MQLPSLDIVVFGEAMAMFIADDYGPLEMAEHSTRVDWRVPRSMSRPGWHGWATAWAGSAGWASIPSDVLFSTRCAALASIRRECFSTRHTRPAFS